MPPMLKTISTSAQCADRIQGRSQLASTADLPVSQMAQDMLSGFEGKLLAHRESI